MELLWPRPKPLAWSRKYAWRCAFATIAAARRAGTAPIVATDLTPQRRSSITRSRQTYGGLGEFVPRLQFVRLQAICVLRTLPKGGGASLPREIVKLHHRPHIQVQQLLTNSNGKVARNARRLHRLTHADIWQAVSRLHDGALMAAALRLPRCVLAPHR